MLKALDIYYSGLHNSSEPTNNGGFMDARHCALCGVVWESSLMYIDNDACEAYCRDCVNSGEVSRYLKRCDYTLEMINRILTLNK